MAMQKKRKARPSNENQKLGNPSASRPAYPGLEHWETATARPDNVRLSETSAYNSKSGKFVQSITVKHDNAFRLRPLVFTEGPLRGHHILLLEPSTEHFPFLELPAEIRQMIYHELYLDDSEIFISYIKRKGHAFRAVSDSRLSKTSARYVKSTGTWTDKPPSALGLLTANKQIWYETTSTLYGNVFKFFDFKTCQAFLEGIGRMRSLLRDISFYSDSYQRSKARTIFFKLREAKGLRSLKLHFRDVSNEIDSYGCVRAATFAADCKTMMVSLHKSRKAQDGLPSILDLVHLTGAVCGKCYVSRLTGEAIDSSACGCEALRGECEEALKEVRGLIAKAVGIEE